MLSPDLQRIEHIRDYCNEIAKTIARYGHSFDSFEHDPDYQRSISFSILQIGELSSHLSQEFRQATADRVQWGPMKGMRNLVAHNYGNMSRDIIWETATTDIPALGRFCEEQLAKARSPELSAQKDDISSVLEQRISNATTRAAEINAANNASCRDAAAPEIGPEHN